LPGQPANCSLAAVLERARRDRRGSRKFQAVGSRGNRRNLAAAGDQRRDFLAALDFQHPEQRAIDGTGGRDEPATVTMSRTLPASGSWPPPDAAQTTVPSARWPRGFSPGSGAASPGRARLLARQPVCRNHACASTRDCSRSRADGGQPVHEHDVSTMFTTKLSPGPHGRRGVLQRVETRSAAW